MKLGLWVGIAAAGLFAGQALAGSVHVRGYTKSDGTYVAPHYRSAPDANPYNNWSTLGNVNPYTGQAGTRSPYQSPYAVQPAPGAIPQGANSYPSLYGQ